MTHEIFTDQGLPFGYYLRFSKHETDAVTGKAYQIWQATSENELHTFAFRVPGEPTCREDVLLPFRERHAERARELRRKNRRAA